MTSSTGLEGFFMNKWQMKEAKFSKVVRMAEAKPPEGSL